MERLALILGHSSTEVTRRYAHLRPEHLGAEDRARLPIVLEISQSYASSSGHGDGADSITDRIS